MTPPSSSSKLFQPISVGSVTLKQRVALAPLTRFRANKAHVHGDLAVEYYAQRASVPGTLLITEATFIAQQAGGMKNVPGIWNDDQIAAWKKVTDAVHAKGSYIYLQLWALGRAANEEVLKEENPAFEVVSSSNIPISSSKYTPRPLTICEIKEYVQLYATAASNSVHGAGFDGVEIHGANGYLIDQFTQDTSNNRTDEYGGSIENRCRFALEVVEAVTKAVGVEKTGIRLSPWSKFQDMRMSNPIPTFSYLVNSLKEFYPSLAYVHVVEPRIAGGSELPPDSDDESNDFIRQLWSPRPVLSAGYPDAETVVKVAEETNDVIAMGRYFISNPDLPDRIRKGIAWTPYNRATFYIPESPVGYTDYPRASEEARM